MTAAISTLLLTVAAEVDGLGLKALDTVGGEAALSVAVQTPPIFDAVNTPCVKVFPVDEGGQPARDKLNTVEYRAGLAICQRSKTTAQRRRLAWIRERVRDHFLGRRLAAQPIFVCTGEEETALLDMANLRERFQWTSVMVLVFSALRTQ